VLSSQASGEVEEHAGQEGQAQAVQQTCRCPL